jgi:WhiB family redox-sensing transcriptional regulator
MSAPELLVSGNSEWMADANCSRMDTSIFFPEDGLPYPKFAREVCALCTVKEECLWFANETSSDYGMWGGMSPTERQEWRKKNNIPLGTSKEYNEWKGRQYLHRPIQEWT